MKRFIVMYAPDAIKQYGFVELYDDSYYVVIDTKTNKVVGYDGGEPEDQSLVRDWRWVVDLLNDVAEGK